MKQTITSLFILCVFQVFSQTIPASKAVFNSVTILDEPVNDFQLISNYYPLKSNIENRNSVIFVSDTPTLNQIENSAITKVSDFFYVYKDNTVFKKIMLINKPIRKYYVASPSTGEQDEFDCILKGDITENRANEIIAEKYDTSARIEGGKLFFNNKEFEIITRKSIREDVLELITKYQLSNKPAAGASQKTVTTVKKSTPAKTTTAVSGKSSLPPVKKTGSTSVKKTASTVANKPTK